MIAELYYLFLCSLVTGLKVSDLTVYMWILKKEIDIVGRVVPNISELAPGNGDQPGYFYFDSQKTDFRIGC